MHLLHAELLDDLRRAGSDLAPGELAGVMAVVETGGEVTAGDRVQVEAPAGGHRPLQPV